MVCFPYWRIVGDRMLSVRVGKVSADQNVIDNVVSFSWLVNYINEIQI